MKKWALSQFSLRKSPFIAASGAGLAVLVLGFVVVVRFGERSEPIPLDPIYTRGLSGVDYFEGEINPAISEVGELAGNLGYSVQWHSWYPDRLDGALEYGVPLNLTWSPYHLSGHHPIDDADGLKNHITWCSEVLPHVAAKVPSPPAILLNTENLTVDQNSVIYHDLAYGLAKRYWPDSPVIWYGPHWATWLFDADVKTDAVSARLYWPWNPARSKRDYLAAVEEAQERGLKVVAYVSLGSGYVEDDLTPWNWVDPYDYDVELSRQQGEFLATQTDTLFAIQLYPAPKDEEVWLKHWRAFAEGYYGAVKEKGDG